MRAAAQARVQVLSYNYVNVSTAVYLCARVGMTLGHGGVTEWQIPGQSGTMT